MSRKGERRSWKGEGERGGDGGGERERGRERERERGREGGRERERACRHNTTCSCVSQGCVMS